MKISIHILILLFLAGISQKINAQAPSWQWAQTSGVVNNDEGRSVCTDLNSNVYVTGNFSDSIITLGSFTLLNGAYYNVHGSQSFVAKYNSSGNVIWARKIGGNSFDYSQDICSDGSGNIYVTGQFTSDTLVLGNTTLINAGGFNIFLVKYDSAGNVLWAKSGGGIYGDGARSVCANSEGDVVITGSFQSPTMTFGSTTLIHNSNWPGDVFVVEYDSSGNVMWAKCSGGTAYDIGFSSAFDSSGNVYVIGDFDSDSISFDNTTLINTNSSGTTGDLFVAKYDSLGNVVWVKSFGGGISDAGESINTDNNGNIIIGGYYSSDTIRFGSYTFTNTNNWRLFLVKMDSSGNILWADEGTGGGFYLHDISTDLDGNIFIAGQIWAGYLTFGNVTVTIPFSSVADIFLMKFDPLGNADWGKTVYGHSDDDAYGISVDLNSNIYITGYYDSDTINFDNGYLTNSSPSSASVYFLAKLFDPTAVHGLSDQNYSAVSFPNPFTDNLFIETNATGKSVAVLLNMQGEKIKTWNLNPGRNEIDTRTLASGVYILQITSEKGIENQKIIKSD